MASLPPADPLDQAEINLVAARLDNGADCSRHESRRLLATIRVLQTKVADLESEARAAWKACP